MIDETYKAWENVKRPVTKNSTCKMQLCEEQIARDITEQERYNTCEETKHGIQPAR